MREVFAERDALGWALLEQYVRGEERRRDRWWKRLWRRLRR
jgi:hypothetical protein